MYYLYGVCISMMRNRRYVVICYAYGHNERSDMACISVIGVAN